jgi:ferric-dicitrate binding protein FerR (iron transport regulator)
MSDTLQPKNPEVATDAEVEQLLARHLVKQPPSAEALERVYASVARTWVETCTSVPLAERGRTGRSWGRWLSFATAAGLVAAAIAVYALKPMGDRAMIGTVARTSDGGVEIAAGFFHHRTLAVGEALRVGDSLWTRGSALVVLSAGGTLRIAEDSRIVIDAVSHLALERGKIYVDKPAGVTAAQPLQVVTRVGLIEHLGTEFEIVSDDQVVRIRVREGQVRFSGATGVVVAAAGTELLASSGGGVIKQAVPTFGRDWQWTAALAPDFTLEGRSLGDFLLWISRELGRPLVFADAQTRESARRTILHGSLHSHATLDALADVLSSTSLTYELVGGAIRVHFSG